VKDDDRRWPPRLGRYLLDPDPDDRVVAPEEAGKRAELSADGVGPAFDFAVRACSVAHAAAPITVGWASARE
jgi:hypothetical protein